MPSALLRFVRFGIVGAICTGLTLVCFQVMIWSGVHYLAAGPAGYAIGIMAGFWLHRHWTFAAGDGHAPTQAARFVAVSLLAVASNGALLHLFIESLGASEMGGEVLAVGVLAPLTYTANRVWSFS